MATTIANTLVIEFISQNQEIQTSRFVASKQSLETQLAELNQQIIQIGGSSHNFVSPSPK